MYKYLILLFLFTSPLMIAGAPVDRTLSEVRFVERMNGRGLIPKPIDNYLFQREAYCSNCEQQVEQSQNAFNQLSEMRPSYVGFNLSALVPFDGAGTCSAMALDFMARYKTECELFPSEEERSYCIQSFQPFYRMDNDTFISRQAAYNTIRIDQEIAGSAPELIKAQKMQSLANFHHLLLEPATDSLLLSEIIDRKVNLAAIINNLPDDTYVIRAHYPYENHKGELYGHTMILVKNKALTVFFDNSQGAKRLPKNCGKALSRELVDWGIPEIRFYKAACDEQGCVNISEQKT